ncbi:MAG: hypothetical protein V6Z81_07610 [Parvularculales bacterium]
MTRLCRSSLGELYHFSLVNRLEGPVPKPQLASFFQIRSAFEPDIDGCAGAPESGTINNYGCPAISRTRPMLQARRYSYDEFFEQGFVALKSQPLSPDPTATPAGTV